MCVIWVCIATSLCRPPTLGVHLCVEMYVIKCTSLHHIPASPSSHLCLYKSLSRCYISTPLPPNSHFSPVSVCYLGMHLPHSIILQQPFLVCIQCVCYPGVCLYFRLYSPFSAQFSPTYVCLCVPKVCISTPKHLPVVRLSWLLLVFRVQMISGGNKNGVEMHFHCELAPLRIQTLAQS